MKNTILPAAGEPQISQPIILDIKIDNFHRPETLKGIPITLFDAINRAFDFDAMKDPNYEVEGGFIKQGVSYKRICRDLVTNPVKYKIGLVKIVCQKGELPKELVFSVKYTSIFANSAQYNFWGLIKENQLLKSIMVVNTTFILSNDTVLTIENLPPGIHFSLYLYPTEGISYLSELPTKTEFKLLNDKEDFE
jgi:hypothetical protein